MRKKKIGGWDIVLMTILSVWALAILLPVINVIAVSFTSNKEYLARPMMLFPLEPTLKNYIDLLQDKRILIGYRDYAVACFDWCAAEPFPDYKFCIWT